MMLGLSVLSLFGITVSILLAGIKLADYVSSSSYELVIAVLSARHNEEYREVIRQTWAKELPKNVKLLFLVGSKDCPFPPEGLEDSYGCKKLVLNFTEMKNEIYFAAAHSESAQLSSLYSGFTFAVHHAIRIKSIGIPVSLFQYGDNFTVDIRLASTKELVVRTSFNSRENNSIIERDGYVYRQVEEYIYPKGFEGIIFINSEYIPEVSSQSTWNTAGGVISYTAFYTESKGDINHQSLNFGSSATSFQFVIHDLQSLKEKVNMMEEYETRWNVSRSVMLKNLEVENSNFQDMVFVDCVDTYRSLPQKLLLFYNWLKDKSGINYNFLLKTDDDTLVIVEKVLRKLSLLDNENMWWGTFRKNWAVNYYGKWRETAYTSSVYPAFACGAGYVLSHDLVDWLANNYKHLYHYQGEDVSLGIWLSALNPNLIDDSTWSCENDCVEGLYNRAQLSAKELAKTWKLYKTCGKMCHCY